MQIQRISSTTASEGFTQSEITLTDNCPRKWYWTYNMMLRKKGSFSWPLIFGDVIHAALEEWYLSGCERYTLKKFEYPEDVILMPQQYMIEDYWTRHAAVMMEAYTAYYKNNDIEWEIVSVEDEVDFKFEGLRLRGKIDLRIIPLPNRKGQYMVDHKTTSRLDSTVIAQWDFRFQFMFYLWLCWKSGLAPDIRGYYINALKKTELRRKNKGSEPLSVFFDRVREDMMTEPEKYFYRNELLLTKNAMEHFETIILRPKIARMQLIVDASTPDSLFSALAMNMNTDYCQMYNSTCQFIDLCRNGYEAHNEEFTQRAQKHEELDLVP